MGVGVYFSFGFIVRYCLYVHTRDKKAQILAIELRVGFLFATSLFDIFLSICLRCIYFVCAWTVEISHLFAAVSVSGCCHKHNLST